MSVHPGINVNWKQQHVSSPTPTTFPCSCANKEHNAHSESCRQLTMPAGSFSLNYYVNATCWDCLVTIQALYTSGKYKTILGLTFLLTVLFLPLHYPVIFLFLSLHYSLFIASLPHSVMYLLHGSTNSALSALKQSYTLICPFTTKLHKRRSHCSNLYTRRTFCNKQFALTFPAAVESSRARGQKSADAPPMCVFILRCAGRDEA